MRVCLLASGSKGNAIYLESRRSRILIDAGLSAREIRKRLAIVGVQAEDLDAIFVTHEHSDHIRGLGPLARMCKLPVYLHHQARTAMNDIGRLPIVEEFDDGEHFAWRDLAIHSFPVTHDSVAPVGFVIETDEGKVGVATDLGIATRLVSDRLKNCRVLILESNHDEDLLRDGPYPWPLKQRVRSNHGHLSNNAAAHLLESVLWDGLDAVFLAHLSETNNHPRLAERCAREVLERQDACHPHLVVGAQHETSFCFQV
ncbi:MAG: MBL fold metallo-hydrolase [Desulfuromonadales bacterium]|uniref:MBL fold metallo-hydrolase n=1 Tax=Desulfuromonas sp. KJ2020 TaxID=2919173 RepID=UPI0020A808A6|nr:MBL fold metallo-hydrolase [Desulfuromonas sp. KJ2020]MCP3178096.1 MBL fold metallo-hydrolase [Desulfuromonas sp. KJ2020]